MQPAQKKVREYKQSYGEPPMSSMRQKDEGIVLVSAATKVEVLE